MNKIVRIGTMLEGDRNANIYCKIEYREGKFSISGVIGPISNGNAIGSCGQIDMGFEHRNAEDNDNRYNAPVKASDINFAEGWNADLWFDFLDIWKKWHLNDMQANCVHQVGPKWTPQDVILYHFELNEKTTKAVKRAKNKALQVLEDGKSFKPSAGQVKICALKSSLIYHSAKLPKSINRYYQPSIKKYDWQKGPTETKSTGWLNENEHPKGYLSKACPTCEYKYGSKWNKVEVPSEVIKFVENLPDTDKQPAWV
jgi:hypothetical protein